MARNYSNTALDTTLTGAIGAGDLSLTVASAAGWPAVPFAAVLDPGSATVEEVVQVTGAAGTTWTVTRGFDGTTAAAHSAGATVRHAAIAGDFTDLQAADAAEAAARAAADATLQPLDADLSAIAALTSAADQLPYATGAQAWAMTTLTAFMRTLLDDANAAAALATLGAATAIPEGRAAGSGLSGGYSFPGVDINTLSTSAVGGNKTIYSPIYAATPITLDLMAFEVTTISAGADARVGLYMADAQLAADHAPGRQRRDQRGHARCQNLCRIAHTGARALCYRAHGARQHRAVSALLRRRALRRHPVDIRRAGLRNALATAHARIADQHRAAGPGHRVDRQRRQHRQR